MCGINGFVLNKTFQELELKIQKMNSDVVHRGPDSNGYFIDNENENAVSLGMQRLSILDVSGGSQPIFSNDKNLCLIFNGEIYNYQKLKLELELKGNKFKTNTDTEVILQLFEEEGISFLEKLDGMFAFCIYDKRNNKLTIARDRLGEKPLYYLHTSSQFIFSSELKSITRNFTFENEIDLEALNIYFAFTFIPAPFTIFKSIRKLKPGHYLELNCEKLDLSIHSYWDINFNEENVETNYLKASENVKKLVYQSVENRMIADVPLGVFLSGGVDSSIIASVMADIKSDTKIDTFSVGFLDKNFDETEKAKTASKHINSNHHSFFLNPADLIDDIDKVILNYDEPFADSSALPSYFISKMTRKDVKVALTGDGGDEVFGGYNRYLVNYYSKKYNAIVPKIIQNNVINPLVKLFPQKEDNRAGNYFKFKKVISSLNSDSIENMYSIISLGFKDEERSKLLKRNKFNNSPFNWIKLQDEPMKNRGDITRARYLDKNISLEGDMLVKVDRASMLASLECRAPFLDHKLMEYTNALPESFLINGSDKKRILKDSFKHLLPKNFFDYPKRGFGIPVGEWLRNELKQDLLNLTNDKFLEKQSIFNSEYVGKMVSEHVLKIQDHTFGLWTIYCFQKWWKANLEE